jgi:hypothetical protein
MMLNIVPIAVGAENLRGIKEGRGQKAEGRG